MNIIMLLKKLKSYIKQFNNFANPHNKEIKQNEWIIKLYRSSYANRINNRGPFIRKQSSSS